MRLLISSLFLVTLCSVPAVSQRMSDRELAGLKGNVESVENWTVDLPRKGEQPEITSVELYDSSGRLIVDTSYFSGERTKYFDLNGDWVSIDEPFNDPRVKMRLEKLGEIDDGGKKKDRRYQNKYKYEFDKAGRIAEIKQYSNDGSLWFTKKSSYDAVGRIELETGLIEGRTMYKESFRYDDSGNEIGSTYDNFNNQSRNKETSVETFTDYKFDARGNWIERTRSTLRPDKTHTVSIERRHIKYFDK